MDQETENNSDNRRTQVNNLPREEKELTAEEQKQVKGGGGGEGGWPGFNKSPGAAGNFGDTPGLNGGDMIRK